MAEIAYCKIFPPIGIARIGDSQDDWFLGPESLEEASHRHSDFSFRDSAGKIRRQGARFRIYAFDSNDLPIREITSAEAEISWTVSLANKKAAWFEFRGTDKALNVYRGTSEVPRPRNMGVGSLSLKEDASNPQYVPDPKRIEQLEIHGGTRTISGKHKRTIEGDELEQYRYLGRFKKVVPVELGELLTDELGRLVVLGGRGRSDAVDEAGSSIRNLRWIRNYANKDDWDDDTSDGPVTAKIVLHDGKVPVEVLGGAWVIVAPPDFAPDLTNIVTLYDVMEEVAYRNPHLVRSDTPHPQGVDHVSFSSDIEPILQRIHSYRWVNAMRLRDHGFGKPGDFQQPGKLGNLVPDISDPDTTSGRPLCELI